MTTTSLEEQLRQVFEKYDSHQLLDIWAIVESKEAEQRQQRERIEFILRQRMEADGATAIPHPDLTCELKSPSPTYDLGKLRALAELVPPEEMAAGFTPAHWSDPVWVEDKYNMTRIKTLVKYGDAVAHVINAAVIPGPARLSIKRREQK